MLGPRIRIGDSIATATGTDRHLLITMTPCATIGALGMMQATIEAGRTPIVTTHHASTSENLRLSYPISICCEVCLALAFSIQGRMLLGSTIFWTDPACITRLSPAYLAVVQHSALFISSLPRCFTSRNGLRLFSSSSHSSQVSSVAPMPFHAISNRYSG